MRGSRQKPRMMTLISPNLASRTLSTSSLSWESDTPSLTERRRRSSLLRRHLETEHPIADNTTYCENMTVEQNLSYTINLFNETKQQPNQAIKQTKKTNEHESSETINLALKNLKINTLSTAEETIIDFCDAAIQYFEKDGTRKTLEENYQAYIKLTEYEPEK